MTRLLRLLAAGIVATTGAAVAQGAVPALPIPTSGIAFADCSAGSLNICRFPYAQYSRSSGNDARFSGETAIADCESTLDDQGGTWYKTPASGYTAYIQNHGVYASNCHLVYWANIVYTYTATGSSFTAYPRMDVPPAGTGSDRCYLGDGDGSCITYS